MLCISKENIFALKQPLRRHERVNKQASLYFKQTSEQMIQNIQNTALKQSGSQAPTNSTVATTKANTIESLRLQVGQTFNIQILATKGQQVQFTLGNRPTTFIANLPPQGPSLKPQDTVQVEVKSTQPNLVLNIVTPPPKNSASEQLLNQLLRQLLPNQQANAKLLPNLIFDSKQLSPAIQAQVTQIIDGLYKLGSNQNGKDLKQQLLTSGLFLESNLKNKVNPALVQADLKGKLLQLQANLQQTAGTDSLQKTVASLLNKVELQQIQSIQQGQLIIDMPLQPNDLIEQIEIDIRKNAHGAKKSWEVFIVTDLKQQEDSMQTASLTTKINLYDDVFSIIFWTEDPPLFDAIQQNLPTLKKAFEASELPLKQCILSPTPLTPNKELQKISLIDIKV